LFFYHKSFRFLAQEVWARLLCGDDPGICL